MPWNPLLHQKHAPSCPTVDETLRRAFAPILTEVVPLRLCIALNALRQKGSTDDPCQDFPR
jgi:hypothetical protein